MNRIHLDSTGDSLQIESMVDGVMLTVTVGAERATAAFSSAEAFLPVLADLESHALALGWISETREAEVTRLKKELAQAKHHADHSDWLAGNFSDQIENFQAEAGDANDKIETLRTTIEQWKREAEGPTQTVSGDLMAQAQRDAYDKVLRLLAGNAAGEGEGEGEGL